MFRASLSFTWWPLQWAIVAVLLGWPVLQPAAVSAAPRADGRLEIVAVDADSGQPIAARMHLMNSRRRTVKLRLPGLNQHADHFYIDGRITLLLPMGQYTFELEAGPEYRTQSGHFEIERHADDTKTIQMRRFVDLAAEGWWAGDLDVTRPADELPLALRAESLSVVPTDATAAAERATSLLKLDGRVVARAPFAWDLPVWIARGELTAIQLIHHHALRDGVVDNEGDGRPRDPLLFPGRIGNGRWSETIYHHLLNCGLRVPPAAGSGAGRNDNPIGTNRVYVYCGDEYSRKRWWEGLEAGRVFVTNGPLLRPLVRSKPPGFVFRIDGDERLELEIGLKLATREPVEYLQIVKNGAVEIEVRLDKWTEAGGRLPPLVFDQSGWFLIRAVTSDTRKYQLASSGPYYVERAGQLRVSRSSAQFFLDWIDQATARLRELRDSDEPTRTELLAEQASAREFFAELLAAANAE